MHLLKKLGEFSIGPIVSALLGFITVPLVTHFILPAEYGKASMFTLAQSVLSLLVYLGLDQAFIREYNAFPKEKKNHLLANAMVLPMLFVIFLEICIWIFRKDISIWLFTNSDEMLCVLALMLLLPAMVVETFALYQIRMEEQGLKYSVFVILVKVLVVVFTIALFLGYEKSFRSVVYAAALAEIVTGIILFFVALRNVRFTKEIFDKALIKQLLKYGLPLIPATMMVWILGSMDKIMIRGLCDYSELGIYSAAFKFVTALTIVQSCFTTFWTPVAYKWNEAKEDKKSFEEVSKLVMLVMVVLCLGILICKNILVLILGEEYSDAVNVMPFLLLYPVMYTMSETTMLGIAFSRKTGYNIIVSLIAAVVNIGLNYLLIPYCGAVGAAIATGISYVAFFWSRTLISRKLWYRFPLKDFVLATVLLFINCFAHIYLRDILAYIISALTILILVIVNKTYLLEKYKQFREMLATRKQNKIA